MLGQMLSLGWLLAPGEGVTCGMFALSCPACVMCVCRSLSLQFALSLFSRAANPAVLTVQHRTALLEPQRCTQGDEAQPGETLCVDTGGGWGNTGSSASCL